MEHIRLETINGKKVYIFEDHATALYPWAEFRRGRDKAPDLITLDYHTDTMSAFNVYLTPDYFSPPGSGPQKTREVLCAEIDFRDAGSVRRAVDMLRHDEQIDTAVRTGIIDRAFVICYDHGSIRLDDAPHASSEDKIYEIHYEEGFQYPNVEISAEDTRRHADLAIESPYLDAKLKVVERICRGAGQRVFPDAGYIFDVDLDYFQTRKSIEPEDPRSFYRLIRESEIITVALEPTCVENGRLEGETITSDFLLARLLEHIEKATK